MSGSVGLVVPVDVVAFCVGATDAAETTSALAGATVVYGAPADQAFIGSDAKRDLTQGAEHPLQQGVHLHWALPDALTRAATDSGGLGFPAVPNRWLVTRLVIGGTTPAATSWIVESDALGPAGSTEPFPVTLLARPESGDGCEVRGLGRATPFALDWKSQPSQMQTLTGDHLTAVSRGMATFASYYPDCRTVFGFCDQLADVHEAGVQLCYVVTGWHDDRALDPLASGLAVGALQSALGWTYPQPLRIDQEVPSFSVLQRVRPRSGLGSWQGLRRGFNGTDRRHRGLRKQPRRGSLRLPGRRDSRHVAHVRAPPQRLADGPAHLNGGAHP